jgi:hypothetical protein
MWFDLDRMTAEPDFCEVMNAFLEKRLPQWVKLK